jgi:hypothetical protein
MILFTRAYTEDRDLRFSVRSEGEADDQFVIEGFFL